MKYFCGFQLQNLKIYLFFLEKFIKGNEEKKIFRSGTRKLIKGILENEEVSCSSINLVFCSDEAIKEYNKKYLSHDYETDVITFYDKDGNNKIESDIFISVDSVKNNAKRYKTDFDNEMKRVMIHGVLHLCGFKDKTKSDKLKMRKRENYYLNKITYAGKNY